MKIYHKKCVICGAEFDTDRKTKITCSHKCHIKRMAQTSKKRRYEIKEQKKREQESREAFDKAVKKYNEYCNKNGFVTYGKYKEMLLREILKNESN